MKALHTALHYLIFTSLFISGCALLMAMQTAALFSLRLPGAFYFFVISGTVCSYNFHWWLTPPQTGGQVAKQPAIFLHRRLHLALFILGLITATVAGWLLRQHWLWLAATAGFVFLYSAPKIPHPLATKLQKIAVGKTLFLAFSWAHVTAALPLLMADSPVTPARWIFILNRAFFIYAVCIVFDQRDREADRRAGIKSLVTWLTDRNVVRLFWLTMAFFFVSSAGLAAWFPLHTVLLLLAPAFLLCLLYGPARRTTSHYFYLLLLDGLMALSAPFIIYLHR